MEAPRETFEWQLDGARMRNVEQQSAREKKDGKFSPSRAAIFCILNRIKLITQMKRKLWNIMIRAGDASGDDVMSSSICRLIHTKKTWNGD